jgi:chemotaxis methyl-accepting protein methylase
VAYASIISSKARIKLYNSFNDVIKDGGRLLYCDTDSIFAAYKKNKLNKKCGKDIL